MRTREEINQAPSFPEAKMVEILLDLRELLIKQSKKVREKPVKPKGRPKKQ